MRSRLPEALALAAAAVILVAVLFLSPPVGVADGAQPEGGRQPVWNPVLFQPPESPLHLFYKEGPKPSEWLK